MRPQWPVELTLTRGNGSFRPTAASPLAFGTLRSNRPVLLGTDFSLVVYEPGLCYPDISSRLRMARNPPCP